MLFLHCVLEWNEVRWQENFKDVAPSGLRLDDFPLFLCAMGIPNSLLEDESFVKALFSVFDIKKDNVLSWNQFQRTMSTFYESKNYSSKLDAGFRFFDQEGKGFIRREEMAHLLPMLCHALQQVHVDMPHPFNCREGVIQWVQRIYRELDSHLEPMRRKQFVNTAKSAPWVMAILTLGGYLPKDYKSHHSLPELQKRRAPPPADKAPSPPTEDSARHTDDLVQQLRQDLRESRDREEALHARLDTVNRQHSSVPEEDDEWTDSEEEPDTEETVPEELLESVQVENDRLVQQVRTLQAELKKQINACNRLRQEKRELMDRNDSLRTAVGKLQQQAPCDSPRASFSPKKEPSPASYPVASIPDQVDSYHAYLSWTFQKERIVQPPTSDEIPVPPANVQKVDVLMKRGDFVHSWKKRLAIATDRAIYYYSEPLRPRGSIELHNVRGVREADSTQPPLTLEILTPDRVWALSFGSKIQLQAWQELLCKAAQENTRRLQAIKEKREAQANAAAQQAQERRRMEAPLSRGSDRLWSF